MADSAYLLSPEVRLISTNKGFWEIRLDRNLHRFISQTQGYILSLCDGTNTLNDIINQVARLYDKSFDECLEKVSGFLEEEVLSGAVNYLDRKLSAKINPYEEMKFMFVPQMADDFIVSEELESIGIILTERCDYNCIYCFGSYGRASTQAKELTLDKAISIIREARSLSAEHIILSGGDPFEYRGILDILDVVRLEGFRSCEISSKGIRLTKEFIKDLKKTGLKRIQISIDSLNADSNDYLSGTARSLEYAFRAIFWSRWYGIDVSARSTVTRMNYKEIGAFIDSLCHMGIKQIRLVSVIPVGKALAEMALSSKEANYVSGLVEAARSEHKEAQIEFFSPKAGSPLYCSGGKTSLFVYPDGDVSICDLASQIKNNFHLGNVYNDSLKNCLRRSRTVNTNSIEACRQCAAREVCNEGCRIISYSFYRNLDSPYPLCNMAGNNSSTNNNSFLDFQEGKGYEE